MCALERKRDVEARTLQVGAANPVLKNSDNAADGQGIVGFLTQRDLETHPVGGFKSQLFRAV